MANLISVRNTNRTPLRLGSTNIPRDGSVVTVDLDDGRVTRDMYRHIGRWILVEDAPDTGNIDDAARVAHVALVAANAMGNWQNPLTVSVIVDEVVVRVATVATGACSVDVGSTATSATTSSDNLLDGLDVNAAAGLFRSTDDTDNGTNGAAKGQVVAPGKWVTFTKASGSTTGLVATATVKYHAAV